MEASESKTSNTKKVVAAIGMGMILSIMLVAIGLAFSTPVQSNVPITGNAGNINAAPINAATGTVKEFTLTMSSGSYQPNPITVNKGDTVRLTADLNSVRGCYTTVVIPKFGVRKTVSTTDNIIQFVASEAGTFQMTCGMNMARGSIVVKDTNGVVPATTDVKASSGGSCGASGGGCGCGG